MARYPDMHNPLLARSQTWSSDRTEAGGGRSISGASAALSPHVRTAIGVAGAALLLAIVLLALAVYYYFVGERAQRSTIFESRERDSQQH